MAKDFEIGIGMRFAPNSKTQQDLEKELQKLEKKSVVQTRIKIDGKQAIKEVETYFDKIENKLYTVEKVYGAIVRMMGGGSKIVKGNMISESIPKVRELNENLTKLKETYSESFNADGSINKIMKTTNENGKETIKTITEYKNKLGEIRTIEEEKVDNEVVKHMEKTKQTMEATSITTNKYTQELNGTKTAYTDVITEYSNGQKVLKQTTESVDDLGRSVKQTKEYLLDDNNNPSTVISQTAKEISNLSKEGENANTVTRNFLDTIGKVVKFQIITKLITAFTSACRESIQVVKDFDKALTEFKKVSDLNGESLAEYTKKLGDLGQAVASTMTQMVEASTQFKKSGFTDEESANLAQVAELYRNIADEELTAGESASFIIAQLKAFDIEADNALRIVDSVNEVSNNYAVSSADLSQALGKVSATLSANNVSFEESLGLLTAISEITRNSSSSARGLLFHF